MVPNGSAEVVSVSPRVPGKSYYRQAPPEERGFKKKTFQLRPGEGDGFDADAVSFGFPSSIAYLRHLWNEDRNRRGLPPWTPVESP
jgi:hypothetical protein